MSALESLYPAPLRGENFFSLDRNLGGALARAAPELLARHRDVLVKVGAWVGREADEEAEYTDRYAPPALEPYDSDGLLVNRIRYNPKWEAASEAAYRLGFVGLNYGTAPAPFALTFVLGYLLSQANVSLHCPVAMTGAVADVLDRFAPAALKARFLPELVRTDGRALTGGTWATERHGGSDVGATTTRAVDDGEIRLYGLKWFASNANGGLALATARPEGAPAGSKGLGVYLVPTHLDDGSLNPMRLRRLKDKLGTRGVPTGEIDLDGTLAYEVAPPPRGFKLMMEALEVSRIHNAMSGAGVQRRAFAEAVAHALRRRAFGDVIAHYPMVQETLLRLLVASEAGFALAFEAARAFDRARLEDIDTESAPRVWLRIATALAKYQTAEDAVAASRSALEVLGGNGYTSEHVTARLVRDAQVLTVWEGPANIQALELLRLLADKSGGRALFVERVGNAVASAPASLAALAGRLDTHLWDTADAMAWLAREPSAAERHARRLLALAADVLAAALLLEEASADAAAGDFRKALVARHYIAERLDIAERRGITPARDWTFAAFEPLLAYTQMSSPPIDLAA